MMMFLAIISAFVFGLIIGAGIRAGGKSNHQPRRRPEVSQINPNDSFIDCREFIGFPLSPATKKLNREFEISTELTAEVLRNRNLREALKIKQERRQLENQYHDLFSV